MNCIDCGYSLIKDGHYNCTYEEGECIKISVLEKENEIFKRANEIIAQQRDDRDADICILENRIEELKEDLRNKKLAIQNRNGRIKELEEENAKLKSARNNCEQQYQDKVAELGVEVSKLIEAKAIIKSLIDDLEIIDGEQTRKLKSVKEAEQFLNSEVEKC